jgi:hypothetical protein
MVPFLLPRIKFIGIKRCGLSLDQGHPGAAAIFGGTYRPESKTIVVLKICGFLDFNI